jgi:chromosome partitioning protein
MLIAQLLVVPVVPALFDLWATQQLVEVAQAASAANPSLAVLAVLIRAPTHVHEQESSRARGFLADLGLTVADTVVRERLAFRRAVEEGLGVQELPKSGPARREIASLHQELYDG